MKRGDVAVFSVSAVLAVVVVAAVAFSQLVIDRSPRLAPNSPASSSSALLVLTWAPSLCKVDPSNQGCQSGHVGKLGQKIILHGLWPQPSSEQFCDVSKTVVDRGRDPKDLPAVDLPVEVRSDLQSLMSDASVMVPHEWYTHGTCSGVPPAEYFGDAVTLTDQAGKVLGPIFESAENGRLSAGSVRDRFNAEFGEGAGKRVSLTCREVDEDGIIVYEVHLSLPPVSDIGTAENPLSLGDLLAKGPPVSPGCRQGHVPT